MVVGIVLPYLKSRGTEKQALRLARGFIESNNKVVLFVIQGWGDPTVYDLFQSSGVKVVNVGRPDNIGKKYVSLIRVFPLIRQLYVNKCDLVINRATLTSKVAGYAGRALFIPVTIVLSGCINKKNIQRRYLKAILAIVKFVSLGCPSKIVSVSSEGGDNLKESYPLLSSRISSIQNGVKIPELYINNYQVDSDKGFVFCFSGSLDIDRKGVDLLLNAIRIIIFTYKVKKVSLVFIGSGQDKSKIEKLAREADISKYIIFFGEVKEPIHEMVNYDCFVLPSRREGMPNVLLEAMSIGMPCVASDCNTGPREVIIHNKNGLLVKPNNSEELAKSMIGIINSAELRERLGISARKTIKESFSLDQMISRYISVVGIKGG